MLPMAARLASAHRLDSVVPWGRVRGRVGTPSSDTPQGRTSFWVLVPSHSRGMLRLDRQARIGINIAIATVGLPSRNVLVRRLRRLGQHPVVKTRAEEWWRMRRQDRRRWAEHVGHGQGRDPTACHCHSTAALSQKRRCRDGDLIQTGQSLLSSKGGRRHQALTLRWWTKTSSEFVVGRHGATGNTSKLVATDRQRQRGPSMAARKSPCPDICCADLVALGQSADRFACARQWSSILGFGVGRSILGLCKKPSPMQSVHNAHCTCNAASLSPRRPDRAAP